MPILTYDALSSSDSTQEEFLAPFLIIEEKNLRRGRPEAIELTTVLYLASVIEPSLSAGLKYLTRVYWPFWLIGFDRSVHIVDGLGNLVSSEVFPSLPYLKKIESDLRGNIRPKTLYEFRTTLEKLSTWPLPPEEGDALLAFKIPSPKLTKSLLVFIANSKPKKITEYRLRPRITSIEANNIALDAYRILSNGIVGQIQQSLNQVQEEVSKWKEKGNDLLKTLRDDYRDQLSKLRAKSREKVKELDDRKRYEIEEVNKELLSPKIPSVPYPELQTFVKKLDTNLHGFRKADRFQDYELVLDVLINLVFEFHETTRDLEYVLGGYLESLLEIKEQYSRSKQEVFSKIEKIHSKYEKQIQKITRGEDLIKEDHTEKDRQGLQTIKDIENISSSLIKRLENYYHIEQEHAERLKEEYQLPAVQFPRDIRPGLGEVKLVYIPTYLVQWQRRMVSPLIIYPRIIHTTKTGDLEFTPVEEADHIDLNPFLSQPRLMANSTLTSQNDQIPDLINEGLDTFGEWISTTQENKIRELIENRSKGQK